MVQRQPYTAADGDTEERAAMDGCDGDKESSQGRPRRGRKTEAAAEPLRAEKGVMQPRTAATGTLRADRDGATGDAEGSQGWLLTRDTKERADRDGRDGGQKRQIADVRIGIVPVD